MLLVPYNTICWSNKPHHLLPGTSLNFLLYSWGLSPINRGRRGPSSLYINKSGQGGICSSLRIPPARLTSNIGHLIDLDTPPLNCVHAIIVLFFPLLVLCAKRTPNVLEGSISICFILIFDYKFIVLSIFLPSFFFKFTVSFVLN